MSLSKAQADAIISVVRAVARAEILPLFRGLEGTKIEAKSAADDLVTVADKAAERALSDAFREILPDARVIGEEAVAEDASLLDQIGQPGQTVIIDPIDGTWNYANDVASFGVIIAVVEDRRTVFGLLYDPSHDDWIMAHEGQGAWFVATAMRRGGWMSDLRQPRWKRRSVLLECICLARKIRRALPRHCRFSGAPQLCAALATNTGCWRLAGRIFA